MLVSLKNDKGLQLFEQEIGLYKTSRISIINEHQNFYTQSISTT